MFVSKQLQRIVALSVHEHPVPAEIFSRTVERPGQF